MWRVDRNLWASLAFVLTACSLVVDFPPERSVDAGRPDARVDRDGSPRDTGPSRDTGPDRDSAPPVSCELGTNSGCGDQQLCCDRSDSQGPLCVDTSGSTECGACGMACGDSKAPHCSARKCECEKGSGQGCADGQLCVGEAADARCLECMADADCAARTDGKQQCVANKCVECDRGGAANDASDDQGCKPERPICSANNTCSSCTTSPNNCPGSMQCDPAQGCTGCIASAPVGSNGCGGTSPVCGSKMVNGTTVQQCRKCGVDTECGGNYCLNATGECVAGCDPDELPIANHCPQVSPICKQGDLGFMCTACTVSAQCAGLPGTPLCATIGTLSGQCVQCRNNTDCDQTGPNPVCSLAGACRPRIPADCILPKPNFDPVTKTCVECTAATQAADCMNNAAGPICTSKLTCGQCETAAQCTTPAAPICNPMTNKCVSGCTLDTQCAALTGTPYCAGGVCVACKTDAECTTAGAPLCSPITKTCVPCTTVAPVTTANMACAGKSPMTPFCITSGAKLGQCGGCNVSLGQCGTVTPACDTTTNTCVPCIPATEEGCTAARPQCLPVPGTTYGACAACDPAKPPGPVLGGGNSCTATQTCVIGAMGLACVDNPTPDAGI